MAVKTVTYDSPEGEELTIDLPARWAICSHCQGEGSSSAHLGAITASEWAEDWDQDDREAYLGGFYDQSCAHCQGGKVLEVDIASCRTLEQRRALRALRAEADSRALDRSIMRMEMLSSGEANINDFI